MDTPANRKISRKVIEIVKIRKREFRRVKREIRIEKDKIFNMSKLINEIIKKYNNENISKKLLPRIYINGRKNLISRCLNNLIDNAIKYANKVELNLNKNNERAAIIGGGDGGVARECISKKFNFIDWFELDPEVVEVCNKHLGDIGKKATEKNSVKCVWGDAFESIKTVKEDTYDHIFVDLNDDQFCIDLAAKNTDSLVRILKPKGVITAQVGSQDKKPKQVENWMNVFNHSFGNTKLSRVYIPSFDCSWNFSSSINH